MLRCVWITLLVLGSSSLAAAQGLPVSEGRQAVGWHSGEAWAMRYAAAPSIPTGFGALPDLAPGAWALAADLGHIPRLDEAQQRVGLGGSKQEDLNKSPLFGRLRGYLGLPGGLIAELGWTPGLELDGVRAHDLFSAGLGRSWNLGERQALVGRLFGQHGRVQGDITCPAQVVGAPPLDNPFACSRRSADRLALNLYGAEAQWLWQLAGGTLHAGSAWMRYEAEVQVDAELTQFIERIQLVANGPLRSFTLGWRQPLGSRLDAAVELMVAPLSVRREPERRKERDDFVGLRLQLRWQPD